MKLNDLKKLDTCIFLKKNIILLHVICFLSARTSIGYHEPRHEIFNNVVQCTVRGITCKSYNYIYISLEEVKIVSFQQ